MKNFMKKNWFVVVLAILLACVSCFYIYDTNKGKLRGKRSNGEDVVYEINGQDVTASAFYESLYESGGTSAVYRLFEKAVLQDVEADEDMQSNAASNAATILSNYQSNYPTTYESELDKALQQVGYTDHNDLEAYLLQYEKMMKIAEEYAAEHVDDLQIRNISYILIMFEDSSNPSTADSPTADEQSRMQAVDDALNAGTDFSEVATTYSEDTSTADSGGELGTIDANTTSLDSAFLEAALALDEGEVSDWVYSSSYGWFRIKNNASTADSLAAWTTSDGTNVYYSLVTSYDTSIAAEAIWQRAESLGMDFKDNPELENQLRTYLGLETTDTGTDSSAESTADASASASAESTADASASAAAESTDAASETAASESTSAAESTAASTSADAAASTAAAN